MNSQELAAALNGREYRSELSRAEEIVVRENGLVVLFGANDDLMEFRGAIDDEIGCYGGGSAYLTRAGLLTNECDNEDCPYFTKLKSTAANVIAKWDVEGYSWVYQTAIPHSTFDIMEGEEKYCRGIVFALAYIP